MRVSSLGNTSQVTFSYKHQMLKPQEILKPRRSNTRGGHQERFYWAGSFGFLGSCTVKADFSAWAQGWPSCHPRRALQSPRIQSEPVLLGRCAHLTLEIIGFLGMEDLRCIPNVASNAFQPVQVILIHILQERRGDEKWQVLTKLRIAF